MGQFSVEKPVPPGSVLSGNYKQGRVAPRSPFPSPTAQHDGTVVLIAFAQSPTGRLKK